MEGVAHLDASKFISSQNKEEQEQFSQQLLRSFLTHGYARVRNHGIPPEIIHEAFEWSHRFFHMPLSSKTQIHHAPGPNPQRGYSSLGSEKTSRVYARLVGKEVSDDQRDMREHFDYGASDDDEFPNIWPSQTELPGFKEFMDDFYISCDKASFMILAALERSMEVHTGTFQDMCKPRNASEARINRYPAIPLSEMRSNDTTRISPHFDLGVITLLFADNIGGLEFQYRKDNRSDVFSPVEAGDQAEMIVSVAETMQRWTQDVLPASLHRVTIPADMKEQDEGIVPERFSIVYLAKADRKASVGVLPEFRSQGVEKYENMTALEYHMRRIATAY